MPELTIDKDQLPVHIGIIMDGNGRWAQNKGLPRTAGHKEGLETARRILTSAANIGIKYVTLYTFSTENWKRTKDEVGFLMNLISTHLRAEVQKYMKDGIRVLHLGDLDGLPSDVQKELKDAVVKTADNKKLTVVFAINHGGKDEIVRSIRKLAKENPASLASLTEEQFSASLDVPELPDVDLLIRTGGEKRLSNFLMWHSAYAELCFSDTLWPDYTEEEFLKDIYEFQHKNRRFGGVK